MRTLMYYYTNTLTILKNYLHKYNIQGNYLFIMCYSPITIKTSDGYKQVPCGHCLECLSKYQKEWSNRMYEELKSHNGKAVFFTLTYDDSSVPKNYLYFYDESTYEIFRSPSQYSYDNTLHRERGERLKVRQDPDEELKSLGIEYQVIDFNVKRPKHLNFISHIHKIYGEYLDLLGSAEVINGRDEPTYDFEEDEFTNPDDLFKDAIYDDNYEKEEKCIKVSSSFRERPVMMFNSVRKKDVQDWLKRGRKTLDFTYFITSEYGPRTLRPHYHGVLFGVSAKESWSMMLDWQKRFGTQVKWSDLDLGKGDGSYCAKYCSKGFFEHPLCAKNFFYPNVKRDDEGNIIRPFTEYHSKHYERCISLFGIDEPIVDPTFHLVSKGFGAGWIESNEERMVQDFKDIDFINTVGSDVPTLVVVRNDKPKKELTLEELFSAPFDFSFQDKIYTRNSGSKDYEECIERLFKNFKYKRVYKGQVCEYGVPRYYREKIFNPGLKVAFSNYLHQVNVELYQQKLGELQANNPSWSDAEVVSELAKQERQDIVNRMTNLKEKMERQYNKSEI